MIHPEMNELRQSLFDAVEKNNVELCRDILRSLQEKGMTLVEQSLLDPYTSATCLHHSLNQKSDSTSEFLINSGGEQLVIQSYDIESEGMKTTKTALHILAEQGDTLLARKLLSEIKSRDKLNQILNATVMVGSAGQRPRQLAALHIAAKAGHTNMVSMLVTDYGVDVNLVNNKLDTPILWAVRSDNVETVEELIKLGADVNLSNDKDSTPLHWAVRYGSLDITKVLLKLGKANPNSQRKLGLVSPLILASALGYTEIVKTLIEYKAIVKLEVRGGETALHYAATNGNAEITKILIQNGADINDPDEKGESALTLAAKAEYLETMEVLAEHGANFQQQNREGNTIWHYAIEQEDTEVLVHAIKCYRRYVTKDPSAKDGVQPVIRFSRGKNPLQIAAINGDPTKVQCLLEEGVDPMIVDESGNNFMHIASRYNKHEIIRTFSSMYDVNQRNDSGDTCLHIAALHGHTETINVLLQKAKLSAQNKRGETPLHVAAKSHAAGPDNVRAISHCIINTHNWGLLDEEDSDGNTALHLAAEAHRTSIIPELRNLSVKTKNIKGNTPLHIAAMVDSGSLLDTFITVFTAPGKDINVNQINDEGKTVLHITAVHGDEGRIKPLIKLGADLSIQDNEGNTILHELVKAASENIEKKMIFCKVFAAIVDEAVTWWCIEREFHSPSGDNTKYLKYRKAAIVQLTRGIFNNQHLNVLAYAAKLGVLDIFSYILNIPDVFKMKSGDKYVYDITGLAPDITHRHKKSKTKVADVDSMGQDISCLELIVKQKDTRIASKFLDSRPIIHIIKNYGATFQKLYALLMIVHILYMVSLTWVGFFVHSNPQNQTVYSVDETENRAIPEFLLLIWPLILIVFTIYYLVVDLYAYFTTANSTDADLDSGSLIERFFGIVAYYFMNFGCLCFGIFVFIWFGYHVTGDPLVVYMLSVSLLIGWMYTIAFLKAFGKVHHFSMILKSIIFGDMVKFVTVFIFVLLGFSMAIHAIFLISPTFMEKYSNPLYTIFVIFNIMIGMGEIFDEDFEDSFATSAKTYIRIVYLLYLILSTIILLNLVIAMMSDSYSGIDREQMILWKVGSADLAVEIEKIVPFLPRLLTLLGTRRYPVEYCADEDRWLLTIRMREEERIVMKLKDKKVENLPKMLNQIKADIKHLTDHMTKLESVVYAGKVERAAKSWLNFGSLKKS